MIVGIGVDMLDSRRIAKSIERFGDRFLSRIFTDAEKAQAAGRADRTLYFAKRFAAKEAIYKALSASGLEGLRWRDANITNNGRGAPVVTLTGVCKTALERLTPDGYNPEISISISDEPPHVLAFVVLSVIGRQDQ
ncbi:MAG: holo-[acyl-carrier-protein] synthase [Rhodospirillaceae bacterium]|nr:holo-[acyl-carrier-protein] synthase [Rhodospirillaceae bacterium]